eukprot:Gb_38092 [translate_table: standard]
MFDSLLMLDQWGCWAFSMIPYKSFYRAFAALATFTCNVVMSILIKNACEEFYKGSSVDESDDDMPELEEQCGTSNTTPKASEENASDEEIVESEVELDNEGVIEPDNDPPQKMGDPSIEVTEEQRDAAQMAKAKAMEAMSDGDLDEAISHLTEAIMCNPTSAIIYASRAGVFVKMRKPNAAIRDANAAIKINPDSAKGYKSRGMARAMLGQWEEAAKDLHLASRLDYDEEIATVLKKVEPNIHKIDEHRRKYERLRKESEERKIERERQRRRAESQDPEMMAAFKDPEVMAALQDGMFSTQLFLFSRLGFVECSN